MKGHSPPTGGDEPATERYDITGLESEIDRCDDSDGNIGDVFRFTARDYFVHYGSQCEDKAWPAGRIVTLYGGDDYGVRSVVMDCAGSCLPERSLRLLVATLWKKAGEDGDEYRRHHWLYGVESLAKQLGDAPLYEKAYRAVRPDLPAASIIEIAQICRNSGDPEKALEWLTSIPMEDTYLVANVTSSFSRSSGTWEITKGWPIRPGASSDDIVVGRGWNDCLKSSVRNKGAG